VSRSQRRRNAQAARTFRRRFGVAHLPFRFDLVTVTGDPPDADIAWIRSYPGRQEYR
jgi:Holliday junction resolvase-like predicted endonuclease